MSSGDTPARNAVQSRRVLAIVPDLFFAPKIAAVAKAAHVELEIVTPEQAASRCAETHPALVLLDLHAPDAVPALALALKAAAGHAPVVGFYSHVEGALRAAALAAGLDQVLPRSAFVRQLPELLLGGPVRASLPGEP